MPIEMLSGFAANISMEHKSNRTGGTPPYNLTSFIQPFTITFFKHASLAIEVDGKSIYIDPVDGYAAYDLLPKADISSVFSPREVTAGVPRRTPLVTNGDFGSFGICLLYTSRCV